MPTQIMQRGPLPRRAFFIADVVTGMILIAMLSVALIGLVTREGRAMAALADQRDAARVAEAALSDLQAGRELPGTAVRVSPAVGGDPVAGHAWVKVIATVRGRSASLVGLVPGPTPPASAPPATRPSTEVP